MAPERWHPVVWYQFKQRVLQICLACRHLLARQLRFSAWVFQRSGSDGSKKSFPFWSSLQKVCYCFFAKTLGGTAMQEDLGTEHLLHDSSLVKACQRNSSAPYLIPVSMAPLASREVINWQQVQSQENDSERQQAFPTKFHFQLRVEFFTLHASLGLYAGCQCKFSNSQCLLQHLERKWASSNVNLPDFFTRTIRNWAVRNGRLASPHSMGATYANLFYMWRTVQRK